MLNTVSINGLASEIFFDEELIFIINIIKKPQMAVFAFTSEVAEENGYFMKATHHVLFLPFDPDSQ